MPQYLKRDDTTSGVKGSYTVRQTIEMSEACVAYLCRGSDGKQYRLVHYQTGSPMLGEVRSRYLQFAEKTGLIPLYDHGSALGTEFDVLPAFGTKLSMQSISILELADIAPRLGYFIEYAHAYGILIRDIRPDCVCYDPATHRVGLDLLANITAVNGRATATKAPAIGIDRLFSPPELNTMGWSIYSDYYALGITLLLCHMGSAALQKASGSGGLCLDREVFRQGLDESGYAVFSKEQKLHYLIAGLTCADAHQRWGYRELLCWRAGEFIPLVQSGRRLRYDMFRPFRVGSTRCWDYDQLAVRLAEAGKGGIALLPGLKSHLDSQNPALAGKLDAILKRSDLTQQGKLFYTVYTLYPGTDGLWWNGKHFQNSTELIRAEQATGTPQEIIGEMLRNRCFSFLQETRGVKTAAQQQNLSRDRQFEQWEREEKGKGASRFLMQADTGAPQSFICGKKKYSSLQSLLSDYVNRGEALKKLSKSLLNDRMFAAWMWSKGSDIASAANEAGTDEEAFTLLLLLCEQSCTGEGKKLARQMFMHFGPYPQLTWLRENLSMYMPLNVQPLCVSEIHNEWSDAFSIDELNRKAPNILRHYHSFVEDCEEDVFAAVCGLPPEVPKQIRPKQMDAFFSCEWKGEKVTPAFLRWLGESGGRSKTEAWAKASYDRAVAWLNNKEQLIEDFLGHSDRSDSDSGLWGSFIMIGFTALLTIFMTVVGLQSVGAIVLIPAVLSMVFLLKGTAWTYNYRESSHNAAVYRRTLKSRLSALKDRLSTAERLYREELPSVSTGSCRQLSFSEPIFETDLSSVVAEVYDILPSSLTVWFYISNIAMSLLQFNAEYYSIGPVIVSALTGAVLSWIIDSVLFVQGKSVFVWMPLSQIIRIFAVKLLVITAASIFPW